MTLNINTSVITADAGWLKALEPGSKFKEDLELRVVVFTDTCISLLFFVFIIDSFVS